VLQPEHDRVRAGRESFEFGRDRRALGLGALGERRDATDRVVAADEVGELLGRRRATAADVGLVG
jgi:hypothetical protein